MCLIIVKPVAATFSDEWLRDFYSRNADGYGFMYAKDGELIVDKAVPKTADEWVTAFRKHEEYACAIHLRMRTHGDIDLANAHPYPVLTKEVNGRDVWMMHNGILSGVASDNTKMSDTWHFIRDEVRPMLERDPDLLTVEPFQKWLGNRIGYNNKLVFADNLGNVVVINKSAGNEFKGCWLSNTYAWSYSMRNQESPVAKTYFRNGRYMSEAEWDEEFSGHYGKVNAGGGFVGGNNGAYRGYNGGGSYSGNSHRSLGSYTPPVPQPAPITSSAKPSQPDLYNKGKDFQTYANGVNVVRYDAAATSRKGKKGKKNATKNLPVIDGHEMVYMSRSEFLDYATFAPGLLWTAFSELCLELDLETVVTSIDDDEADMEDLSNEIESEAAKIVTQRDDDVPLFDQSQAVKTVTALDDEYAEANAQVLSELGFKEGYHE